ncbi:DUF1697 domain-containing protein [Flammeovirga yaeyamensis]|uniref:DUF1697 domain-containing protein n=1 Tax=Flammeovirga yaeyamensis TaxID=367791 RepID=A0AAX1N6D4_9BACT|nr:DUF1697 domain-containing protein [Flammeovirga yaeyamensis]MBB3697709.1 uncharacterized protein (DUF1697 family) [Flammeovirga yaeyamensis]NMF35932.1 DUF1697 domain-containing protein [Flammeovirga yaeyamensis]QWG03119.1 DUF1697 domain-containing protein [Flammeovirga yaeyamensis]
MKLVAILRGINVGGKRKILMADLKKLVEELGGTDITTYIQSGNVIFSSDEIDPQVWSKRLEKGIADTFGFDVPVIVLQQQQWQELIDNNPYKNEEINQLHVTILDSLPKEENKQKLAEVKSGADQYQIINKAVYLFCAGKYHETKLGNNVIEKKLGVKATTRNWKMVGKVRSLLET